MGDIQNGDEAKITVKYSWTINNFSQLDCKKLYSDTFFTGIHPWRILVFPRGNKVDCLSIYLAAGDTSNFPVDWSKFAEFKLSLINQVDPKMTVTIVTEHLFNAKADDFGFTSFMTSEEFRNPNKGFLVNDTFIVVAKVYVTNSRHEDIGVSNSPTAMSSYGELIDFKGLCKIEKDFVPLLEEVCSKYPALVEYQQKKNKCVKFIEWPFTSLGKVLHFLKTKKVKDMNEKTCMELQNLWDLLGIFGFDDLSWLEPHVQFALSLKNYAERAAKVKKMKQNVIDLDMEFKSLKEKMDVVEADLEIARSELVKEEEGFVERGFDDIIGYGMA